MKKTTTPIKPEAEKPRLIWSMKQRINGEWQNLPLNLLAGKTLRQVNVEQNGQDVVAEFVIAGEKCYLCGTDDLKKRMAKKGKAITFAEADTIMATVAPEDLDLICPPVPEEYIAAALEAFPGISVDKVELCLTR